MNSTAGSDPSIGVEDVLITAELANRPSRNPDYETESRALELLVREMSTNPRGVLQKCAELVMELCHADSAGISILEPGGASGVLRWHAAAGGFAPHLHGVMPREASPCGTVMERNCLLLFQEADQVFPALQGVEPRIYENLLAPWHAKGRAVGTLWAIKHTPEGRFDAEDARILQSLARVAAAAFQMTSALDEAMAERSALRASEQQLRDALDTMTDGFALLDTDFTVVDVNAETVRLDGRTRNELVGRNLWEIFPGSEASQQGEMIKRVMRDRAPDGLEHSYQWPDGKTLWIDTRAYPTSHGRVGILWRDITERRQADERLKESEERYRALFNTIDEGYCIVEVVLDQEGAVIDLIPREANPAWRQKSGIPDSMGQRISELIPNLEEHWLDYFGSVVRTGQPRREDNYMRDVGRWFSAHYSLVGELGSNLVAVVFDDITARMQAEATMRENAERQAFLLKLSDTLRPLAGPADIQGETTRLLREQLNAGWCYYVDWDLDLKVGLVLRDSTGDGLSSLAGAHDVSDALEFLQLLAGGALLTVADYAGYEQLPARTRQKFVALGFRSMMIAPLVKEGRLIATLIVGDTEVRNWSPSEASLLAEVAERTWAAIERAHAEEALRESEGRARLLLAELQHRVRNILGMVRSVVRRSVASGASVEEVGQHLEGRLSSMGRTQAMLTRSAGAGVDLEALIREELLAQSANQTAVAVEGPSVELAPKAAEVLTLAIHELATNATKYGAFAQPGASLDVTWTVESDDDGRKRLRLAWQERGVEVRPSSRIGFGTELIKRRVPYELHGTGDVVLQPGGLRAEIAFPLVPGDSILASSLPKSASLDPGRA